MLQRRGFPVFAFLLAATLAAAPPASAGDFTSHSLLELDGLFGRLWQAFATVVGPLPAAQADSLSCSDRGSIMDPNGCPQAEVPPPQTTSGSIMDPNG